MFMMNCRGRAPFVLKTIATAWASSILLPCGLAADVASQVRVYSIKIHSNTYILPKLFFLRAGHTACLNIVCSTETHSPEHFASELHLSIQSALCS